MKMTFEESLQAVCKELLLSSEDRQSFTKDAEMIRNELMYRMKEHSKAFRDAYNGLNLTGSYLDHLKIDLPDEFDLHIKLKMNFPIKPVADPQIPGFVILKVPSDAKRSPVVASRYLRISRYLLQCMIRNAFKKVFTNDIILPVNGRNYKISYPKYGRGFGVAHTIIAKEIGGGKREISFDFVPAFEFQPSEWPMEAIKLDVANLSWFAVPFGKKFHDSKVSNKSNRFTFMATAPHWERKVLHDKKNLKNSLRLMKALRDVNQLERLSSYMLKSIYLEQIEQRPENFWEKPIGVILIEMLKQLADALRKDCLPFFLHNGFNHLDLLPKKLINEYQTKVSAILVKLHAFQEQPRVDFVDIASLFIHT